jgi:putative membrane protein
MDRAHRVIVSITSSALLLAGGNSISRSDQIFAAKAARGGMEEVQLGQLATNNAGSQNVKDFGKKMVADHSKAVDQLKSIAGKNNISLPADVAPKDKALIDRLMAMSGSAFDKAYMNVVVKDHEADIADFQKEASSGTNTDLKDFASGTLPVLKEHLSLAEDTAGTTQVEK